MFCRWCKPHLKQHPILSTILHSQKVVHSYDELLGMREQLELVNLALNPCNYVH